jgi:hypothetical protein
MEVNLNIIILYYINLKYYYVATFLLNVVSAIQDGIFEPGQDIVVKNIWCV